VALRGHTGRVNAVRFLPAGGAARRDAAAPALEMASASSDGTVCLPFPPVLTRHASSLPPY
jgi:hypothetical protein